MRGSISIFYFGSSIDDRVAFNARLRGTKRVILAISGGIVQRYAVLNETEHDQFGELYPWAIFILQGALGSGYMRRMNRRLTVLVLFMGVVAVIGCAEAPPEQVSAANYQSYFQSNRWYWSRTQAKIVEAGDFKPLTATPYQTILATPRHDRIIYSELEPTTFFQNIKSFYGMGKLSEIDAGGKPIFNKTLPQGSATEEGFMLIGFVKERAFTVEVNLRTSDREKAQQAAMEVARSAFKQLEEAGNAPAAETAESPNS